MKKILLNLFILLGICKPYTGLAQMIQETTLEGTITQAGECRECGGCISTGGRERK